MSLHGTFILSIHRDEFGVTVFLLQLFDKLRQGVQASVSDDLYPDQVTKLSANK